MAFLRFQLINTGLIDVRAMENESALSQQDLTRMKNNEETMFNSCSLLRFGILSPKCVLTGDLLALFSVAVGAWRSSQC